MNRARVLALSLFLLSCASTQPPRSDGWVQWATPEDAGFDSQALEDVRAHADKVKSGAEMVVYRGKVLAAWGDVERKLALYSVRESLYAALYGVAVGTKLIVPNATVGDFDIAPIS